MNSTNGLFDLLSNVQSLESSIAAIILETTLKLSALTSASVLLVIDANQSRKIAGSSDLVSQYRNCTLTPNFSDSVVSLDSSVSSLVESPLIPSLSTQSHRNGSLPSTFLPTHHANPDYHGISSALTPSGSKRKSHAVSGSLTSKRPLLDCEVDVKNVALIKEEPPNASSLSSTIDGDVPESDSDIEILDEELAVSSSAVFSPLVFSSIEAPSFSNNSLSLPPTDFDCTGLIARMELNGMKIETLQNLSDPTLPFQKGTMECRLISSLFYDFGKELKRLCPFDLDFQNTAHREYFAKHVEAFQERFPNLQLQDPDSAVSRLKVEVGSDKRYTPAAYLRVNARNGFKARVKVDKKTMF